MGSPARLAALLVLLTAGTADAHVSVPPFSAPAGLSPFGREVATAVATSLSQAGVDVGSGGTAIAGRIEELDGERLRLSAQVGGRSVQVEGPLEEVDRLAADLSSRLLALVPQGARRGGGATAGAASSAPVRPPETHDAPLRAGTAPLPAPPVATTPASRPAASASPPPAIGAPTAAQPRPPASLPSLPASTPSPGTPAPVAAAPAVTPAPAAPAAPPAAATPSPAPAAAPSVPSPPPPPPMPPTPAPTPGPPDLAAPPAAVKPIPPPPLYVPPPAAPPPAPAPPRVDPVYEAVPPPPSVPTMRPARPPGAFELIGRALLHHVGTDDVCGTASSDAATRAARNVLDHLHVQTVLRGCGIPGKAVVMSELQGAASSTAVLANIESLTLDAAPGGFQAVGRVRIVVVRDGQTRINKLVEARPRLLPVADVARASYDVTDAAFSRLSGELQAVLWGAR